MNLIKEKIFTLNQKKEIENKIFMGVSGIEVNLIEYTRNPYKCLVEMALMTWGDVKNKWEILSPEERFYVTTKVLNRKALPLGMEAPSFLFSIYNVTRSSFDQIARVRVGATISSLGWNNIHSSTGFRIPNEILDKGPDTTEIVFRLVEAIKETYLTLIKRGISWQEAREILPMGLCHWYNLSISYLALQNLCSKRLCFSEKEDTVATAWLMRQKVKEKFPLLATYLRPLCDWQKQCIYHQKDSFPEEMGSLFKSCGRNQCRVENPNVEFDFSSSDKNKIESQLKLKIPNSNEDFPPKDYAEINEIDRRIFEE